MVVKDQPTPLGCTLLPPSGLGLPPATSPSYSDFPFRVPTLTVVYLYCIVVDIDTTTTTMSTSSSSADLEMKISLESEPYINFRAWLDELASLATAQCAEFGERGALHLACTDELWSSLP